VRRRPRARARLRPCRRSRASNSTQRLDDSDAHAEYKQVTVLFADVVHSMDIASVVGAERLREIMAALVDRAAIVVQRYEGTAGEFTGDGIMAVLGGRP
jgi:class 3 adenylate cyclase